MSAHTPGPWVVQGRDALEVMGPDFKIVEVDIGEARHNGDHEAYEAAQADARLIAAAPDLLAACEAALAYDAGIQTYAKNGEVNLRDDGSGYAQGADLDALYGAFVSAARAAIAKTKGQS